MMDLLEFWPEEAGTDLDLLDCITEYVCGRGGHTMEKICSRLGEPFQKMACDQDEIGWRWFMEGMICTKMFSIQSEYHLRGEINMNPDQWAKGVVLKLLEETDRGFDGDRAL
jgi:hypothetical protein